MSRTRVLLVSRPSIGGAAKYLLLLVRWINKALFDVTCVVSPLEDPAYPARLQAAGARVIPLEIERKFSPWKDLRVFRRLLALMRAERFDIVHTQAAKAGLLGRLAARLAGIQRVFHTPHGFYFTYQIRPPTKILHYWLERGLARLTTRILLNSRAEEREVAGNGFIPPGKLLGIPNGIDLGECRPAADPAEKKRELELDPSAPVIGMVGRLSPPKDYPTLVGAAQRVLEEVEEAKFLVVGEGELHAELKKLVKAAGLGESVFLLGQRETVSEWISLFDVSVLSSRSEGLPYFLLESMALRKPVVASRVSGCEDVVRDGETGFLVKPGDPQDMAEAILRLLRDPVLARRLGDAGRKRVEQEFEVSAWVRKIESAYLS